MSSLMPIIAREAVRIAEFVLRAFAHTWPLWVVSIPLATAVRMTPFSGKLKTVLSKRPLTAIITATAVGAISPLCSCSVIPVIFSLLTAGVPLAPVMAFWLASPSMDPEVFFLSVSYLGWPLAIARLAATTLMSLGGGLAALALERRGYFSGGILRDERRDTPADAVPASGLYRLSAGRALSLAPCAVPIRTAGSLGCACSRSADMAASEVNHEATNQKTCCSRTEPQKTGSFAHRLTRELLRSVVFVARFMAIAFVLEAIISFYIPEVWIRSALGEQNVFSVPLAVLVGVPFYTTNAQALGLIGGMLGKGLGEGAALAFLIGGATTTLPAMSAVFGIAKPRVFALYLGTTVATALAVGFAWSLL